MPMPDAQIHPTATGKAIKIVEAHQDPQDFVFYSGEEGHPFPILQSLKILIIPLGLQVGSVLSYRESGQRKYRDHSKERSIVADP